MEQIAEAAVRVATYIEASDKDGFYPFDVAEALDMEYWLVQDVFNQLVKEGMFETPTFEPGFCPHPSFAIVSRPSKEDPEEEGFYSLHCYECREDLPFFFYTEKEWADILAVQKASNTKTEVE